MNFYYLVTNSGNFAVTAAMATCRINHKNVNIMLILMKYAVFSALDMI